MANEPKVIRGIGRIIVTSDCVAEGAEWLAAAEPRFAAALEQTGPLPLRLLPAAALQPAGEQAGADAVVLWVIGDMLRFSYP